MKTEHQRPQHEVVLVRTLSGVERYKIPLKQSSRYEPRPSRFDVDIERLDKIIRKLDPEFNYKSFYLQRDEVIIGNKRFKFRDIFNLITILRYEGLLRVSVGDLHDINHQYIQHHETV